MRGAEVGSTLDRRYRLRRLIAKSERGSVWDALHVSLERAVAIRMLEGGSTEELAPLFEEARRLERVHHPSLVRVHDVVALEGGAYLAMDPIEGRILDGVLAVRGTLAIEEAVQVAVEIGEALAAAHDAGYAHGRLCPSSVLLTQAAGALRSARLLDLGVSPCPTGVLSGPLAAMAYVAPEILEGAPIHASGDIYSVGALLGECLTSLLPSEEGALARLRERSEVPASLAEVVRCALAPVSERYPDMRTFLEVLRASVRKEAIASQPPPARRAHPRAGYVTPVRLLLPGGEALDGRSEDISEGGLLVLAPKPVAIASEVLVRFALPLDGRIVSMPAETRWMRSAAGREALGLRFLDPSEKVRADIRAYVEYLGRSFD